MTGWPALDPEEVARLVFIVDRVTILAAQWRELGDPAQPWARLCADEVQEVLTAAGPVPVTSPQAMIRMSLFWLSRANLTGGTDYTEGPRHG